MDMLQFFTEKLNIKSGFAELLNDIGINQKIFLDYEDDSQENPSESINENQDVEMESS